MPGSKRALVMIGDADPLEPGYTYGGKTYNIFYPVTQFTNVSREVYVYMYHNSRHGQLLQCESLVYLLEAAVSNFFFIIIIFVFVLL
jgi:hypothetical protein